MKRKSLGLVMIGLFALTLAQPSQASESNSFAETVSQIAPYWLELNHPYIRPGIKR